MRYKNDKIGLYQICHHQIRFFQAQNAPKSVSAVPDPAGGAYDAPPDRLVGWGGGYPLPIPLPARRLRRLELGGYFASVLMPLNTKSWLRHASEHNLYHNNYNKTCKKS